jgi:serine/threonine-protein kinase
MTVSRSLTESGVVLGTLAYMPPEQLLGKKVDHRGDLYAAGVILVEMLTGRRPFEDGSREDLLGAALHGDYHLPPGLPNRTALDGLLQRCLAKAPQDRFPSAPEMRGALIPALRACDAAASS